MYGLSDDLIDYRDRALKLEAALRLTRNLWQNQLSSLEALSLKTTSGLEVSEQMMDKLRKNIEWVDRILEDEDES